MSQTERQQALKRARAKGKEAADELTRMRAADFMRLQATVASYGQCFVQRLSKTSRSHGQKVRLKRYKG